MANSALMSGFNHAPASLGRVAVLGLGVSGRAAVEYLAGLIGTRVDALEVYGGPANDEALAFAARFASSGAVFTFDDEEVVGPYDLCVASPGISEKSAFYRSAAAASTEVVSEVELAWRECPASCTWVAVTGTNGKTTTTSLITHLLRQAGVDAASVGNIGLSALDAVSRRAANVYVAEVSSFQLASTRLFAPKVAVILNVTPDHLSWHGGFEAYAQAKFAVLAHLGETGGLAVLDATDDVVRAKIREIKAIGEEAAGFGYVPIGTASGLHESMIARCGARNAAYLDGEMLTVCLEGMRHTLCRADDLQIKGQHNLANALAASSAVLALGVEEGALLDGLVTFAPLEHRIEPCGCVGGVQCFNDSKATNVDATLKALTAFPAGRVVILLGGRDKGTELDELVAACRATAHAVVCFGEAAPRFLAAFAAARDEGYAVFEAVHLEDALDVALSAAQCGDAVLLSPACSSFDEFRCYEQRGEVFKQLVAERASRAQANAAGEGDPQARAQAQANAAGEGDPQARAQGRTQAAGEGDLAAGR